MELEEEDTSRVLVNELPKDKEYSLILRADGDVVKRLQPGLHYLASKCIARGMRLEKEKHGTPERLKRIARS